MENPVKYFLAPLARAAGREASRGTLTTGYCGQEEQAEQPPRARRGGGSWMQFLEEELQTNRRRPGNRPPSFNGEFDPGSG